MSEWRVRRTDITRLMSTTRLARWPGFPARSSPLSKEVFDMTKELSFVDKAVFACEAHDAKYLREVLRECVEHTSVKETQRLFREEVPLQLGPKNLTWLLRQITDEEGFARSRDHILDALTNDLIQNGHVPGRDFSFAPDKYVGRRLCLDQRLWEEIRENISDRSARHYRCFIRLVRRSDDRARVSAG